MKGKITCTNCNTTSTSEVPDAFQLASRIDVESCRDPNRLKGDPKVWLDGGLDVYAEQDVVEGRKCDACGERKRAFKALHLLRSAPYVFIGIQRWTIEGFKDNTKVLLPQRMQLDSELEGTMDHEIVGFAKHLGIE